MDKNELRKFIHDLRNALNTANITATHLGLHVDPEGKPILGRLEIALTQAAQIINDFEAGTRELYATR